MKNKRLLSVLCIFFALFLIIPASVTASDVFVLPGQISYSEEELYPGVTAKEYYLEEGEKYSENGPQFIRTVEFDPKQEDLAFDVVMAGDKLNTKKTTTNIVKDFNSENTENKKVIASVNGDLWTMAEYHSRVIGSGTVFNGHSDPVVKKELCLPRGTVISDGEIICSQDSGVETPYEELFQSFGITPDGVPLIGNLYVRMTVSNDTKGSGKKQINNLNRLPSDNALILYTDKGPASNYCLDDAYEVIVDCGYDYTVRHGEVLTGTVVGVSKPGESRMPMTENRLILTARGESSIAKISGMEIGNSISVTVSLTDSYGKSEEWRTVTEAVGGHVVILKDGEKTGAANYRFDPMTLIGYRKDGTVVMLVNDGRQEGYSMGINRLLYADLCLEMGLDTVFCLDGGGSTTLVEKTDSGYELKNRPSDSVLGVSVERPVVNAVVLSYISNEPEIKYTVGDIDNGGTINGIDGNLLLKIVQNIIVPNEVQTLAADVNSDTKINATDANIMKRYLSGLITSF